MTSAPDPRTRHVNRNRPAQDNPRSTSGRDSDGDVRGQIRQLRDQGGTYRSIAAAAGLAPATSKSINAVTSASLRRARVDAGGTRLRLRALHVMGHGSARIARALGIREMTVRAIVRGDAPTVSTSLRDQAADLYDAWWDKRAPERDRF